MSQSSPNPDDLAPASTQERHDPGSPRQTQTLISTETRNLRSAEDLHLPPGLSPTLLAAPATLLRTVPTSPRRTRQRSYDAMVHDLKATYKIQIRKWRSRMSGVAYELKYHDGRIKRLITAPRPRSPVSASIFLHEVGHHAIGFHRYRPRCLEEYYVWQWAFREMTSRNIPVTSAVLRHYRRSMFHYVRAARKYGLRDIPHQLHPFLHTPA